MAQQLPKRTRQNNCNMLVFHYAENLHSVQEEQLGTQNTSLRHSWDHKKILQKYWRILQQKNPVFFSGMWWDHLHNKYCPISCVCSWDHCRVWYIEFDCSWYGTQPFLMFILVTHKHAETRHAHPPPALQPLMLVNTHRSGHLGQGCDTD